MEIHFLIHLKKEKKGLTLKAIEIIHGLNGIKQGTNKKKVTSKKENYMAL